MKLRIKNFSCDPPSPQFYVLIAKKNSIGVWPDPSPPCLGQCPQICKFFFFTSSLTKRFRAGPPPPPAAYASLLNKRMFDFSKNSDFTWLQDDGQTPERQSDNNTFVYKKPYGWNKVALNDKDKCDENCDPSPADEACEDYTSKWAVAYHGKRDLHFKQLRTEDCNREKASHLMRGIYSCPDPAVAAECAPVFTFRSRKFQVMIQSRVNMKNTTTIGDQRLYCTRAPVNIKPVGLLIKSID